MSLQGGQPKKVSAPKCKCGRTLGSGPRLIVDGWWRCPDCVYLDEHPGAVETPPPPRPLPLQREQLFDKPS